MALAKLEMVGLTPDDANKFPAELSGGMTKRVALARALALDPEIVFLDEPTSGLDPISAGDFDELIRTLQQTLGLTVFMVTHDLESLYTACDRVAVLADGKVVAEGPIEAMLESTHPWVRTYFQGKRGELVDRPATERLTVRISNDGNTRPLRLDRTVHARGDPCELRLRLLAREQRRLRQTGHLSSPLPGLVSRAC